MLVSGKLDHDYKQYECSKLCEFLDSDRKKNPVSSDNVFLKPDSYSDAFIYLQPVGGFSPIHLKKYDRQIRSWNPRNRDEY